MFLQAVFVLNVLLSIVFLLFTPNLVLEDLQILKHLWVGYLILCILYTAGKEQPA